MASDPTPTAPTSPSPAHGHAGKHPDGAHPSPPTHATSAQPLVPDDVIFDVIAGGNRAAAFKTAVLADGGKVWDDQPLRDQPGKDRLSAVLPGPAFDKLFPPATTPAAQGPATTTAAQGPATTTATQDPASTAATAPSTAEPATAPASTGS